MIKFKSLSSGSAGNCYYLGIFSEEGRPEAAVLIDAGVSIKRLRLELKNDGLTLDNFDAVLVTHDHFDHIRSLGSYCKHLCRPVWATSTLHGALARHMVTSEQIASCRRILAPDTWTEVVPGRISVRSFVVPHDATQTVGFAIMLDGYRYVHITDCGRLTPEAMNWLSQAQTAVLESNYDPYMLSHGHYPPELQERIRSGNGHLSENNNTPELAFEATRAALDSVEAEHPEYPKCRLQTLPRQSATPLLNLNPVE